MRTIDADRLKVVFRRNVTGGNAYFDLIDSAPTVEAIPKDQYEARLKADLMAILVELQTEFEELENPFGTRISGCSQDGWKHGVKNCDFVIQQRINAWEGNNEQREKETPENI